MEFWFRVKSPAWERRPWLCDGLVEESWKVIVILMSDGQLVIVMPWPLVMAIIMISICVTFRTQALLPSPVHHHHHNDQNDYESSSHYVQTKARANGKWLKRCLQILPVERLFNSKMELSSPLSPSNHYHIVLACLRQWPPVSWPGLDLLQRLRYVLGPTARPTAEKELLSFEFFFFL